MSAHDERTKTGVVIGFYLRALRVCSEEYIDEEIEYINRAFSKLGYPKGMLALSLSKARGIIERKEIEKQTIKNTYIVVPDSTLARSLSTALRSTGTVVVCDSGKKISELVAPKRDGCSNENSIVYRIPCNGCDKAYYGETHRGLNKRVKEHKADVRHHRPSSALVNHIDERGHLPNWERAVILEKGIDKLQRKTLEALHITINENLNQRTGDIKWRGQQRQSRRGSGLGGRVNGYHLTQDLTHPGKTQGTRPDRRRSPGSFQQWILSLCIYIACSTLCIYSSEEATTSETSQE